MPLVLKCVHYAVALGLLYALLYLPSGFRSMHVKPSPRVKIHIYESEQNQVHVTLTCIICIMKNTRLHGWQYWSTAGGTICRLGR